MRRVAGFEAVGGSITVSVAILHHPDLLMRETMKRILAACLLLGLTCVGCAQTSPQTEGEATPKAATQEDNQKVVILYGGRFNPEEISVAKGTSIVFKNKDRETHNVKIAALDVDKDIAAGDEWSHTFETVGEFAVENAIAQQPMKMTIVVDEGE